MSEPSEKCRKTGKVKHPDKASAMRHIAVLIRRHSEPSMRRLQAYQCQTCQQWHLGTPRKRMAVR